MTVARTTARMHRAPLGASDRGRSSATARTADVLRRSKPRLIQLDPFAQATSGFKGCPVSSPPLVTPEQMRIIAHERAERGTYCALEGRCEPGGAYRRDPEVNERVRAAIAQDKRFADTSVAVTTTRRFVTLTGCVQFERAASRARRLRQGAARRRSRIRRNPGRHRRRQARAGKPLTVDREVNPGTRDAALTAASPLNTGGSHVALCRPRDGVADRRHRRSPLLVCLARPACAPSAASTSARPTPASSTKPRRSFWSVATARP